MIIDIILPTVLGPVDPSITTHTMASIILHGGKPLTGSDSGSEHRSLGSGSVVSVARVGEIKEQLAEPAGAQRIVPLGNSVD